MNFVKLPGHRGTITAVDFHPKEPISEWKQPFDSRYIVTDSQCLVLTGSKDTTMLLGELEPGMRL